MIMAGYGGHGVPKHLSLAALLQDLDSVMAVISNLALMKTDSLLKKHAFYEQQMAWFISYVL